MPATRHSLVRVFQIHRLITERHYPSLDDLAEQCGVNPRTVKRDLRTLREEFAAPLAHDRTKGGYYYAHPFNLDALPLSEGELLAVCMLRTLVDGAFRNTHLAPAVRGALEKLQILLPETVQTAFADDAHGSIAYFPDPSPPENAETCATFKALMTAILEHRPVQMDYFSMTSNTRRSRKVDPYLLFHRDGMWYLRAFCHLKHETRDFALGRIRALTPLTGSFPPPDLSAIRAELASRFGAIQEPPTEVAIRFDADWARRIRERVWHPSQQLEEHPDGACTLRMTVEGLPTVASWVLGFAGHAVPLIPPRLVQLVEQGARAVLKGIIDCSRI